MGDPLFGVIPSDYFYYIELYLVSLCISFFFIAARRKKTKQRKKS